MNTISIHSLDRTTLSPITYLKKGMEPAPKLQWWWGSKNSTGT